jgi:hypothetical protein
MRQRRTPEFWAEVRRLVESGLSLKKASQQFKLAYSYLVQKAAIEGWRFHGRGRPRKLTYVSEERRAEIAKSQAEREALEARLRQEATIVTIDVQRAELLRWKVLSTHSQQMKVALSELVVRTAHDLASGDTKPKDRAVALVALRSVCDSLYAWSQESASQRDQPRIDQYLARRASAHGKCQACRGT